MRIDHVIYGTADLDAAAARVEAELGLAAAGGGRHDGIGTQNRIVPLGGGSFLELLAITDPREAGGSPLGAALQAAIGRGDGLLGWAVAVGDVETIAARLGTQVSSVGRQGQTARLTAVAESIAEPCLPFFIERSELPADAIDWLEVTGDARRIERWIDRAELPVRVVEGEPAVRAVGVGGRGLRTR